MSNLKQKFSLYVLTNSDPSQYNWTLNGTPNKGIVDFLVADHLEILVEDAYSVSCEDTTFSTEQWGNNQDLSTSGYQFLKTYQNLNEFIENAINDFPEYII